MMGNWIVVVDTDPITDKGSFSALLKAENSTVIDTPVLAIRCKNGKVEVLISADKYLADNTRITLRYGSETPIQERWSESGNNTAFFLPGNQKKAEEFIRKLSAYDRLVAQVSPYNRAPMAMVFQLAGIDEVSQELGSVCPVSAR